MRILFLARHFSYLRNFESAIRELAARGHSVHLAADREESLGGRAMVDRIAADYDTVSVGSAPARDSGPWYEVTRKLRLGLDYLRFLEPLYAGTRHLRTRARERAPKGLVALAALPGLRSRPGRRFLVAVLQAFERAIPRSPELDAFIIEQRPDVILITPLVDLGSPQVDHFASARAAGIPTVLCVGSWDHLSSKALLRQIPDGVILWNETQRAEAVDLHGVPPSLVTMTGAQCYDLWFGRQPSRSREAFCREAGLDPTRPYVLWVCSSLFRNTASEADVAEKWIQATRSSHDPTLRECGLLIRPHPARLDEWRHTDLTGYRNLAFRGTHPVDTESRDDYFDAMYHSAAVVGLNTSAFLDAAAVGRPVYSILLPEVSPDNQEGTIHFHYLLTVGGGLLHTARSIDAHLEQLAAGLRSGVIDDEQSRRFAEAFIRPFGLDQAATPRFADAVERVTRAESTPTGVVAGAMIALARPLLLPWLLLMKVKVGSQPWRKELRYKIRKAVRHYTKRFYIQIKSFAVSRIKGKVTYKGRRVTGVNLTPKLGKSRDPSKRLTFPGVPEVEETKDRITMLGRTRKPIIVGPWLTETGFELLYWIPFLNWAKVYGGFRDSDLYVVSRGGCALWYRQLTTNYFDILSVYSPDEFRALNEERMLQNRGRLKHMDMSAFDEAIVERVTKELSLENARLLHPSLMYNLFNVYWRQIAPLTLIEAFTAFRALPQAGLGPLATHLPERYVAVKFYSNGALPDSPENRALVANVLRELTQTIDVVMLNTGQRFDDHTEYPIEVRERLHTIDHLMTPATNLEVQTRVIANAAAFVGTYGGFSYMAPLLGVDTLAYFSHPTGFRWDHLELAKRVFSSLRGGSFVALDTRDLDVLRLGLGRRFERGAGHSPVIAQA
jgi:hypothetical protein